MPEYMGGYYFYGSTRFLVEYWLRKTDFENGKPPNGIIQIYNGNIDEAEKTVKSIIKQLKEDESA